MIVRRRARKLFEFQKILFSLILKLTSKQIFLSTSITFNSLQN